MSILALQSSWWWRGSWLLYLICLPGVSWWLSGSSSRCHGVVCGLWLWYFLIILTYYFLYFDLVLYLCSNLKWPNEYVMIASNIIKMTFYTGTHVSLNLLNEFSAGLAFYRFFTKSLINPIIQEHELLILFIIHVHIHVLWNIILAWFFFKIWSKLCTYRWHWCHFLALLKVVDRF